MERDCESELSKLNIEQNACIYHFGASVIHGQRSNILRLLYMVQTEDDAYDIAQETFLKFMKYGTSYKHHNFKGYLLTIARNICFNYFRDKKEKVTAIEWEEIDKIPNNKDMLTEAEDAVCLRNLLKELSQDTREVIILRIYEEMKFKDIAKIMGCSVSTTKSRFRLGVNQLKKLMENDYER